VCAIGLPPCIANRLDILHVALHVFFAFGNRVAAEEAQGFGFRVWRGEIEERIFMQGFNETLTQRLDATAQ
jgi:hypothetical protein